MKARIKQLLRNCKRRIQRRLKKKQWDEQKRRMFKDRNIHYDLGDKTQGLHCGGIGLIHQIIAASNRDLEQAVQEGHFRPDLYYRLNVLPFHLPPLRERPEDIRCLVWQMMERFQRRFQKAIPRVSPEVLRLLQAHPWPGNIRQLENAVQLAVLTCTGPELLPAHLPAAVLTPSRTGGIP